MKQNAVLLVLSFLLASCAASLPYATDYPLTKESFRSRDGVLKGQIPQGWVSASEDTLAPALMAWLIKEDFSATLAVEELRLDARSRRRVEEEGLKLLAHLSLSFPQRTLSQPKVLDPPKEFNMRGKQVCSYEVESGGERRRVVVFSAKGRFYECKAIAVKGKTSPQEVVRLYTAQQTLLSSLTF